MIELTVHTLISEENREGGLLLCGINHGYSKEDERQDFAGINRLDSHKSFFSDHQVNDYDFRNRIVTWFSLWGFELASCKEAVGQSERSIVQTNWLQTCSNNVNGINTQQACIDDNESFFGTCLALKPAIIFFFGQELLCAFTSPQLNQKAESIFGKKIDGTEWLQKDVYFQGKKRRRFRFGFQRYEKLTIVSLPHATGAKGVANDYIKAFKPEMSAVISSWWLKHKQKLTVITSGQQ
jgi:hypothetical protein